MATDYRIVQDGRAKQALESDQVHKWYRFVLSFPDRLVRQMLERFGVGSSDVVLDPFSGTGTTLVECKKHGIDSIGLEANPACAFASRVKTTWDVDPNELRAAAKVVSVQSAPACSKLSQSRQPLFAQQSDIKQLSRTLLSSSREGQYFVSSGMLERGWISVVPFFKVLSLLNAIKSLETTRDVQDALKLALVAILVERVGNVSFGPELYVSKRKADVDLLWAFAEKTETIASDLERVREMAKTGRCSVLLADARDCGKVLTDAGFEPVDFVITSPPYPTEKDYTRQTRLELVFLGYVYDRESLRGVKKSMVRSHSKGIYKADNDGRLVADVPEVRDLAGEMRERAAKKTYGFAKLYPRIVEEYFGGMYRHLTSLFTVLKSGGMAAYVVGEQRTYLQTFTPTGEILSGLAERIGFTIVDLLVWRVRRGTTGSRRDLKEHILILQKP